jgi:hypothetical protein
MRTRWVAQPSEAPGTRAAPPSLRIGLRPQRMVGEKKTRQREWSLGLIRRQGVAGKEREVKA